MSTETVTLFFALLAVVAQVWVVVSLVLLVGSRLSGSVREAAGAAAQVVGPSAVPLALCVAAVCTAGSLYLSEVAHFPPCRLCWYQRIAMYPLVPILGVAAWRRDVGVRAYALVLTIPGMLIAAYHVLVERYPSLETSVCEVANPCTIVWVERFGYLTIPAMALCGFALITSLLLVARPATVAEG